MKQQVKSMLASYARSFAVAVLTAYSMGTTDLKDIAVAGLIAVIGPAIRAANPNDPAFGIVADKAEAEIKKLVTADKKKAKKQA